jgi:hypothetical protein
MISNKLHSSEMIPYPFPGSSGFVSGGVGSLDMVGIRARCFVNFKATKGANNGNF